MDSQLKTIPILVFKITTSDRFTDIANAKSMQTSLEINRKLVTAFRYISLLVKIGSAISEVSTPSQYGPLNLMSYQLNPIAKVVMGLIEIANSVS